MLKLILYPFMALALLGFLTSLIIHICAMLGWEAPEEALGLHIGIFVVALPANFAYTLTRPRHQHHWGWREQFTGCPSWMKYAAYGLFAYAGINLISAIALPGTGGISVMRLFSGHWMLFYWFSFAMLYGVLHHHLNQPQCLAGHTMHPGAKFCERCGQPVLEEL